MEATRQRFLRHARAAGRILDVGCGSGRDSKRYAELGYALDARDRSREIADEARRCTGLAVRVEDVLEMDDRDAFDGIWASAMLIHREDNAKPTKPCGGSRALRGVEEWIAEDGPPKETWWVNVVAQRESASG